jgi:ribosome biogenesis GTPase
VTRPRRPLDEDDVRVRPGRGSRPRTRTRPAHDDAHDGVVVEVDRGRYTCRLPGRQVVAVRAGNLRRRSIVVGDRVSVVGDVTGGADALGRIVRLADRRTVLRRSPDDTDPLERVVVANADLLIVVTALADPPPRPRLIDRCLVAAYDGGLEPVLCLTKADLADPDALRAAYAPLGVPVVATEPTADLGPLRGLLADRTSVFFGHSGVGKSTLVNRVVPGADRAVAAVSGSGRGRHVSSSVVALPLPDGPGWVIDTPGIRSFGLGLVSIQRVLAAFPDLAAAAERCPRGCRHTVDAPDCALDEAPGEDPGEAPAPRPERVGSFRRLLAAKEGGED